MGVRWMRAPDGRVGCDAAISCSPSYARVAYVPVRGTAFPTIGALQWRQDFHIHALAFFLGGKTLPRQRDRRGPWYGEHARLREGRRDRAQRALRRRDRS